MIIWILGALIVAFFVSYVFGERYIPWLQKHGCVQHLKDEVKQEVYQANNTSNEHN